LGPLYAELVSGHNLLVYAAFLSVALVWWLVWRSRFGLRLRAAGELPALIFGRGRPLPVLFACLLFGLLDTVAPRLQGMDLPLIGPAPVALVSVLPYAMTVVLLAGFFGRAVPPRALGRPFVKEH
ncbi:MAG: ABC transporter permease, partial [Alphaproteobacteria bacterium]|nr:ABC transporter permease [Alphaproteobacteria bacterium]